MNPPSSPKLGGLRRFSPLTGGVTTQYGLDAVSDSLFIQNPPNAGTQTAQLGLTIGAGALDFTQVVGFDIPSGVAVATSAAPATGTGWLVATVGGVTDQYRVNLATEATVFPRRDRERRDSAERAGAVAGAPRAGGRCGDDDERRDADQPAGE